MEPGAARLAERHIPGSVEHVILPTGRVRIGPATTALIVEHIW
jgi:hypothetical protein